MIMSGVFGSSCQKFLSIDETNPNSASLVPPDLLLAAALNATATNVTNPNNYDFIYLWYGLWCVSNGYSQPTTLTQYNLANSAYYQLDWENAYLNMQNYDYMELNSASSQNKPYRAIAKIMKVYIMQYLVDTYGNVPYSQALKAGVGNLKPGYDNQQAIYEDLVIQLDSAMNLIDNLSLDAVQIGSTDIVYGGDMGLWKKFANTIKLRMLINQSGMSGRSGYISTALATTPHTTADYIGDGEGAWANPGYLQSTGKMNPFWEIFYKQDGSEQADGLRYYMAGQDACNFLTDNNDPRKTRFFVPYTGETIQGNYFGALVLQPVPVTSLLGPGLLRAYNQSAPLFTESESLFLQAEAVSRGLIDGDAKALYEDAVTQSIVYEGGTAGDAGAYLAQASNPQTSFDVATDKINLIITQKWISLNGLNPMPIWTDFRRTGFPNFLHFSQDPARQSNTPPVRLLYPQTELNTNNENVLAQGVINAFTSKIFWQNR